MSVSPFRAYEAMLGVRSAYAEWLVGARVGTPKVTVQEPSGNYADRRKSLKEAREKMKATPPCLQPEHGSFSVWSVVKIRQR